MNWRMAFFAINTSLAVGMVAIIAHWIWMQNVPFDTFGWIVCFLMMLPFLGFALAEWGLFRLHAVRLERPLGFMTGLAGALMIVATVLMLLELLLTPAPLSIWTFGASVRLTVVVGAMASIGVYGLFCCWKRLNGKTTATQRGFEVL